MCIRDRTSSLQLASRALPPVPAPTPEPEATVSLAVPAPLGCPDPRAVTSQWVDLRTVPVPVASDATTVSLPRGDPMEMLSRVHTRSPSPEGAGGARAVGAVGGGVDSPHPSTPAGSSVDSSVTLHLPRDETSSCPNVSWGAIRKPPRPSSALREEVMRRQHSDWRYGPQVPPKPRARTPGVGKDREK